MDIIRARELAKATPINKQQVIEFDLLTEGETRVPCQWVDPKEGSYVYKNSPNSFMLVDDHLGHPPLVTNMKVVSKWVKGPKNEGIF